MAVALGALYFGKRVHADMIITGEVMISGRLLPVGGLCEKAMAGLEEFPDRVVHMIVPHHHRSTLSLEKRYANRLKLYGCEHVDDMLELAIIFQPGESSSCEDSLEESSLNT